MSEHGRRDDSRDRREAHRGGRDRDYDSDREDRRRRHRLGSEERRGRRRSRSRSNSRGRERPERRERKRSNFSSAPPDGSAPGVGEPPVNPLAMGASLGMTAAMPGGMGMGMGSGMGAMGILDSSTKTLRELFIGNTPPNAQEHILQEVRVNPPAAPLCPTSPSGAPNPKPLALVS